MAQSPRSVALEALYQYLHTHLAADNRTIVRNGPDTMEPAINGLIDIRDGEPGEPAVYLSPILYVYHHRVEVEIQFYKSDTSDAALDQILLKMASLLTPDQTLGGAVQSLKLETPEYVNLPSEGRSDVIGAIVPVILEYEQNTPLG